MRRAILAAAVATLLMLPGCMGAFFLSTSTGTGFIVIASGDCTGWLLRSDQGGDFPLLALPAEFQESGLRVKYTVKLRNDVHDPCSPGKVAEVVSLTRV